MDNLYDLNGLAEPLCCWYQDNRRSMPWRLEPSPYHVWLSEIMLQQTRIEAVKAYYSRFIERLPDVRALAEVPEEELLKLWEGLGYYNRARNLKRAAMMMVERYEGKLPADYDLLLELPGIGSYTAGAVASIAYGIPVPAVDGNVLRVLMRYLDCYDDISRMSVRKKLERSIEEVIPAECPGEFNQALMELGETLCIPNGTPLCEECPLCEKCAGHLAGHERQLPVKQRKKERRVEERTIIVFEKDGYIGLTRRADTGLLARMWEFPSLSGEKGLPQFKKWMQKRGIKAVCVHGLGKSKHIFSHVEWHMTGYFVKIRGLSEIFPDIVWAERGELLKRYAIPTAFRFYLEKITEEQT